MNANMLANPNTLGGCVYYSQNREDLILQSFFPDVKHGFYVDVGAYDPDIDSVTKLFYLNGWSGINIEPQPEHYLDFVKKRKRDINLNIGISDKSGNLTLRTYKSGGLSTFSDEIKENYQVAPDDDTRKYTDIIIPVMPLSEVFAKHNVEKIHFLKVDVEGFEYEVLKSNDWKKYRPEVICTEANHILHDWRPLLKDAGYEKVFDDNLNFYYVDKNTDRKSKFNFIKDVIHDRGGGIRADYFDRMNALYGYGKDKEHHVEEIAESLKKINQDYNDLSKKVDEYQRELNSIAATTKRLISLNARRFKSTDRKS